MKKIFFLLLPILMVAQNQRFVYQYRFIKDTLKKAEVSYEIMNLDILPKFSKFYSYTLFKNDSTAKADYDRQTAVTGGFEEKPEYNKGCVKYTVVKLKPENSTLFFERIGTIKFKVHDGRKLVWKIFPEKKKIENYICQKAITDFGGRSWTAWFTDEIPLQDGPYKFSGLPGLIVEIYDDSDTHHFKIIGNHKLSEKESAEINPEATYIFDFGSPKETDLQFFRNYILETRKDPNKSIRQLFSEDSYIKADGKMMEVNEYLRNREAKMKEKKQA